MTNSDKVRGLKLLFILLPKALIGLILFPLLCVALVVSPLIWLGLRSWELLTGDTEPLDRYQKTRLWSW